MGKAQKKTGKGRLDKYYKLAKEQGYRARSAFKLIQLNKKYAFLENSRCTIDLCAAPGGWLQVASKYMPVNSVIVGKLNYSQSMAQLISPLRLSGVDLVPIKPIPRVVTFAADITTPQCRNLIRNEIKDWKADVVLHDGAPNVGTAWVQDAYSQSELVLMSLKLGVEFLAKGGTFVTKVFRSVDYNNLIWVFNQLFGKVEATKPPSSRNVSAEIFVVCRDFLAPKFIDPKFLDPRHVFKEIALAESLAENRGSNANNVQASVFQPEKKRRHRDGYADGDYTLHKTVSATDFIKGSDPIAVLGSANKIAFLTDEEKKWLSLDITTSDVKANCDDLKVLGKGDFKTLLKWRLALRQELGLDNKTKETEELTEVVVITEDVDEERQISDELERLNAEAAARAKRERRRANEVRTRTIQRMQLQMTAPLDVGLEQQDLSLIAQDDMFDLSGTERGLQRKGGMERLISDEGDIAEESEEDVEEVEEVEEETLNSEEERERRTQAMEDEFDGLYSAYQERLRERDAKYKVKEARQKNAEREEWSGIGREKDSDEEENEEGGWDDVRALESNSSDHDSSEDLQSEVSIMKEGKRPHDADTSSSASKRLKLSARLIDPASVVSTSKAAQVWFSQDIFAGIEEDIQGNEEDAVDMSTKDSHLERDRVTAVTYGNDDDNDDDFEIVAQESVSDVEMWDAEDENEDADKQETIRKLGLITPEAVTLAQNLVNRKTTRTKLINDGFNRYSLNSKDDLPAWFLDDEAKHYIPNLPITKDAVRALREKQRALDARPIKKIAEAKARKKLKAHQRLEKALKKAEGVNSTTDISEREKAQQIEKLMQKGLSKSKKAAKSPHVVVAKGAHKGIKGRPKGIKGRYTMVDARMKKEVRAKKRKEKANKKRKH
ncbi:hypothetical protein C0993_001540 [Termitomyces sp. T159_Od127]|nr:hypothetical protein C0993_001540 [Termitomyces sp. T159_Od127]